MPKLTPEERFWKNVDKTETCWLWARCLTAYGYGNLRVAHRGWLAHRFSYEMAYGPIPEGLQIDHICHVRACVNPSHLRLATNKQNNENMISAQRNSKTGVLGVVWRESKGKYKVSVMHNRKQYNGGYFLDLAEAEAAAISLRNELFTHNVYDRGEAAA